MTWISPWHSTGVSARQSRAASRQENADSAVSRFVDRGESPHRSDVRPRRRSGRAVSGEFRSAYLAAGVAMARLTPDGVLIDANTSFARLLGRPGARFRGRRLLDLLHPDDAAALRAGRLSTLHAGPILAELRFEALRRTVWGRASLALARQAGDAPD